MPMDLTAAASLRGFAGVCCVAAGHWRRWVAQGEIADSSSIQHGSISSFCCRMRWRDGLDGDEAGLPK